MNPIAYFKLQAKNLFKDFKTQKSVFDEAIEDYLYEYNPTYFEIDKIILEHDINEDKFTLMKAQHIIAYMAGFKKWTDMLKASDTELELSKLVFDNQDKIDIVDWVDYIGGVEDDNNITLDAEAKLEIFKKVFVNVEGHYNHFGDNRLTQKVAA